MFKSEFNVMNPYTYVRYGRMSDPKQNARSPDQQFDTIDRTIDRIGPPWTKLEDYRDNGISGRLLRSRPGFSKMLSDIRSRRITPDLILVDTYERFGRADELPEIRRELRVRHGVLLLTADTGFADPTTTTGRVLGMVEDIRATEANRVKAHDVLRGKFDAVQQGHWPGSKPPFGLKSEAVFHDKHGRTEISHYVLIPNADTAWIIQLLFSTAVETGWGHPRLTRFLNSHPDIADRFKPFHERTVGSWLQNEIYCGTCRYNVFCTDIVDDRRLERRNPESEIIVVNGFCEPLVDRETWDAVQLLRGRRAAAIRKARELKSVLVDKQIAPLVTGISIKYPLAGLIRCGLCGRSMTPVVSSPFKKQSGEIVRYVHYHCPASHAGVCRNAVRIDEAELRNKVIDILVNRLFVASVGD